MAGIGETLKQIGEYGYPLVLSLLLIWYVYNHQKKLDMKTDKREDLSQQREEKYRVFIADLRDGIKAEAVKANNLASALCDDFDTLHDRVTDLKDDVEEIHTGVCEIKRTVTDISEKLTNGQTKNV